MGKYIDFYRARHTTAYGTTGKKHVQIVTDAIKGLGVRTVLDWGAGSDTLARALGEHRPDWTVSSYDPAVPGMDKLPTEQFDAVISTDVLEHIPHDELDEAIKQIMGLTRIVGYHHIANYPARECFPDGTNLHVVQEGADWWKRRFEDSGALVVAYRDHPTHTAGNINYSYACITIKRV